MINNTGRKLKNGRPAGRGLGKSPSDFIKSRNTQRGWVIDHRTGLRIYR